MVSFRADWSSYRTSLHLRVFHIRSAGRTASRWLSHDELGLRNFPAICHPTPDYPNSWLVLILGMAIQRNISIFGAEFCEYQVDHGCEEQRTSEAERAPHISHELLPHTCASADRLPSFLRLRSSRYACHKDQARITF